MHLPWSLARDAGNDGGEMIRFALFMTIAASTWAADPIFFNGKDLSGWHAPRGPSYWSVEDGAIVGRSGIKVPKNQFIWSRVPVADFYLSVDVKITPDRRNAGIQFRSLPRKNGEANGYQADVGTGKWGRLFHEGGRGKLDWRARGEAAAKPKGWNRYEILAVGDRVWLAVNGKLGASIRDPKGERTGFIGFQLHAGLAQTVQYGNLKLVHNPKTITLAGLDETAVNDELIAPQEEDAKPPITK